VKWAIAEEDETHMIPSLYRPRIVHRKAGEALPSEREPLALLKQLQRTLRDVQLFRAVPAVPCAARWRNGESTVVQVLRAWRGSFPV
jgi:hypothetical protein